MSTPAEKARDIMDKGRRAGWSAQHVAEALHEAGSDVALAASLLNRGMSVAKEEPMAKKTKVQQLADDINELPAAGKAVVGMVIDGMTLNDEQHQILVLAGDVQETKSRLKTLREMQQDLLEQEPKWHDLQDAKAALKGKEDALRIALSDNADYNNRQEDISGWKFKLADQEEILSQHLIAYRLKHDQDAVEIDDTTERPIKLKASLGKQRDIQTTFDFGGTDRED